MKTLLVLLALGTIQIARADTFGFNCITTNSATDCGIAEAQLTVEVSDAGSGQVLFTFRNAGPANSSITDVYFDDGTLLGIATINNTPLLVEFSQGASPGDLPGGNAVNFQATAGFTADSDPPAQPNGVNPGEQLGIVFDLLPGVTFADTIAALTAGTDLRIGIHVQGFTGGGSESLVNDPTPFPPQQIPEPGSVLLLGAMAGTAQFLRKLSAARS